MVEKVLGSSFVTEVTGVQDFDKDDNGTLDFEEWCAAVQANPKLVLDAREVVRKMNQQMEKGSAGAQSSREATREQ